MRASRAAPGQRLGGAVRGTTADRNLPLGLAHLADEHRCQTTVPFGPGDQMLFYTDGVSEARDKAGTFFPLALSDSRPMTPIPTGSWTG